MGINLFPKKWIYVARPLKRTRKEKERRIKWDALFKYTGRDVLSKQMSTILRSFSCCVISLFSLFFSERRITVIERTYALTRIAGYINKAIQRIAYTTKAPGEYFYYLYAARNNAANGDVAGDWCLFLCALKKKDYSSTEKKKYK